MRPLYLSLDGVNSFLTKQEIDFQGLSQNNIFCICGATGSGKTTILDSIILALYGDGDRSDTIAEYINIAKKKAEVVFRFLLDDTIYEIRRELVRSGSGKCFLTNLSSGKIEAEKTENVNKYVRSLIGLSRNEFTQVVVLEQGKFNKFLTAEKPKRSRTVSQLFGLERYDGLAAKFGDALKYFENLLANNADKLIVFADATKENLQSKKQKCEQLKQAEKQILLEDKKVAALIKDDAVKRSVYDSFVAANAALEVSKAQLKALDDDIKNFNVQKAAHEAEKSAYVQAKKDIEKTNILLENLARAIKEQEGLSLLKKGYENLLKEQNELKTKSLDAAKKVELAANSQSDITKKLQKNIDILKAEIVLKPNQNPADAINKISDKKAQLQLVLEKMLSLKSRHDELTTKLNELKSTKEENFKKLDLLKQRQADLKTDEDNESKKLEHLKTAAAAYVIASGLNEGDPCPVCGSAFCKRDEEHTSSADSQKILQAEQRHKKLKDELASVDISIASLNALEQKNSDDIAVFEKDRLTLKTEADNLIKNGCNYKIEQIKQIIEQLDTAAMLYTEKLSADIEHEKLSKLSTEALHALEKIAQRLIDIKSEIARWEESHKSISDGNLQQAFDEAKKQNEAFVKTVADYEKEEARLTQAQQNLHTLYAEHSSKVEVYSKQIKQYDIVDYDISLADKLKTQKEEIEAKLRDVVSAIAALETECSKIKQDLKKRDELEKERTKLVKKRDTAHALGKLFAGNKFLEYAEEEYIQKFTLSASEGLFSLSGGKYGLEYVPDDKKSDFFVVDYLRGGEKRKVRTLSGGETFLASVSMAIAISKEIAAQKNFGFFFLDEGFGTLDSEAMAVAADALTALSQTTLVGVITHRSELTERIPSKIKVIAATETEGSKILN